MAQTELFEQCTEAKLLKFKAKHLELITRCLSHARKVESKMHTTLQRHQVWWIWLVSLVFIFMRHAAWINCIMKA